MRKKLWICAALLSCLFLSGCQETPEEDVIVQKQDVEKQLEENTELAKGDTSLREYLEAPETVDLSLTIVGNQAFNAEGVTVTVPEALGLPSAKMSRYSFDEAYLEKAAKFFFKEADIYKYEDSVMTKSDYQWSINELQKGLEIIKSQGEKKQNIADVEANIDELTAKMGSAPDTWIPKNEPVDYVFNSEGDFLAKATVDGSSASLTVSDTETYSCIIYNLEDLDALYGDFREDDENLTVQEGVTNRCQYTREEAIALCEKIISELIPDDNFVLDAIYDEYDQSKRWDIGSTGSVETTEMVMDTYTITELYGYSISFTRQVNGVKETQTNSGIEAKGAPEGYIPFDYETLTFHVTDKGIISFSWYNCMKMNEIIYNNVSVLSFSQIKTVVETNLPLKYADYEAEEGIPFKLDISEIRLGLMCLRNKNDNNSFTMVPVWDVIADYYKPLVLCINAIDGSVIDRGLRY